MLYPFPSLLAVAAILIAACNASPVPNGGEPLPSETLLPTTTFATPVSATLSATDRPTPLPELHVPPRVFGEVVDTNPPPSFVAASSLEDIARRYIASLTNVPLSILEVSSSANSTHNNLTNVHLRYVYNQQPIVNLASNVNIRSDGSILSASPPQLNWQTVTVLTPVTPRTPIEAFLTVATRLGMDTVSLLPLLSLADNDTKIIGAPFATRDVEVTQKLYLLPTGQVDPIWDFDVMTVDSGYRFWVSMTSGELLAANDLSANFGPSGMTSYKVVPFTRDSLADGVSDFDLPAEQWHLQFVDDKELDTTGNNVRVLKNGQPIKSRNKRFDYTYDITKDPTASFEAVATSVFYVTNKFHDVFYQYGFTESHGNFQSKNFGRGGLEGDGITVNIQTTGNCNANFFTPPDGSAGTMNLYICDRATPARDTGMDNSVVIHELAHGLSNRLTGGKFDGFCLQTLQSRGMGEGWSDTFGWWATMLATDTRTTDKPSGSYYYNNPNGDRQYVYSTNTNTNPLVYSGAATQVNVHPIGTIWATMLYEVYHNMVDLDGFEPIRSKTSSTKGNIRFMQLLIDALKIQPCNPTFVDARNAWLQADRVNYGQRYRCEIWRAFAKRGLGFGAENYVDSFTLPSGCV